MHFEGREDGDMLNLREQVGARLNSLWIQPPKRYFTRHDKSRAELDFQNDELAPRLAWIPRLDISARAHERLE